MGLSRSPPQDGALTGRSPSARAGEAARVWGCRRPSAATAQPGGRSAGWSLGALGPPAGGRGGECGLRGESSAGGELRGEAGQERGWDFPPECTLWPLCRMCQSGFVPFRKRPEGQRAKSSASPIPPESPGGCAAPPLPHPAGTGLPAPPRNSGAQGKPSPVLRRSLPSPSRERSNFFTPLLVGRKKGLPHPRLRKRFTFQWQLQRGWR